MIALLGERFTAMYAAVKAFLVMLAFCAFFSGALSHASCGVDVVIVNGRVEHAPRNATVRVQLIYPKQKDGESGEVTVEGGTFRIPIWFITQSRAPLLNGSLGEKCDRRPRTVVVSLVQGDQEYDHVSLDLTQDFKLVDPSAYAPRSELVLHGPPAASPTP
jgi:hypothetical protein